MIGKYWIWSITGYQAISNYRKTNDNPNQYSDSNLRPPVAIKWCASLYSLFGNKLEQFQVFAILNEKFWMLIVLFQNSH